MTRLFLDSADRDALARWLPLGPFHGVTTNPTILARAGLPCTVEAIGAIAAHAFAHGAREMQAQAWGGTREAYLATGRALAALDGRMVVKLPATEPGIAAAGTLLEEGARVTLTAVYAPHQALTARAMGVHYVAPYFGRMRDAGIDAVAAVRDMLAIAGDGPRVLVASLRSLDDLATLAARGADTFTFGPDIAGALVAEPATLEATMRFERDAGGSASPTIPSA